MSCVSTQMMAWCAVEGVRPGRGSHSGSGSATSGVTCNVVTSHCQPGAGARHQSELRDQEPGDNTESSEMREEIGVKTMRVMRK